MCRFYFIYDTNKNFPLKKKKKKYLRSVFFDKNNSR